MMRDRICFSLIFLLAFWSSAYGDELIINDREWVLNGFSIELDGSIDQVTRVIGQPSYESSHEGPSKEGGGHYRYIWVDLGLIVNVKLGCIQKMDVRIAPLLKSDLKSWARPNVPEDNVFPRFPGSVKIGSLDLQPDTDQKEIQAEKAPPKFRGTDTFPTVNQKEGKKFMLMIDRSQKERNIKSIFVRSYHKVSTGCPSTPITPQYSFEDRHKLYETLVVKPIEKDTLKPITDSAKKLLKTWLSI